MLYLVVNLKAIIQGLKMRQEIKGIVSRLSKQDSLGLLKNLEEKM